MRARVFAKQKRRGATSSDVCARSPREPLRHLSERVRKPQKNSALSFAANLALVETEKRLTAEEPNLPRSRPNARQRRLRKPSSPSLVS